MDLIKIISLFASFVNKNDNNNTIINFPLYQITNFYNLKLKITFMFNIISLIENINITYNVADIECNIRDKIKDRIKQLVYGAPEIKTTPSVNDQITDSVTVKHEPLTIEKEPVLSIDPYISQSLNPPDIALSIELV